MITKIINNFYDKFIVHSAAALSFYSFILFLSSLILLISNFSETIQFTLIKENLYKILANHLLSHNYELVKNSLERFIEQIISIRLLNNCILVGVFTLLLISIYRQLQFICNNPFKSNFLVNLGIYILMFVLSMLLIHGAIFANVYSMFLGYDNPYITIFIVMIFIVFFIATIIFYFLVPVHKKTFKNIILVSLIITVLLEVLQYYFFLLVDFSLSKSVFFRLYSSLFMIIIFIYLFWIIILFGATLLHSMSS